MASSSWNDDMAQVKENIFLRLNSSITKTAVCSLLVKYKNNENDFCKLCWICYRRDDVNVIYLSAFKLAKAWDLGLLNGELNL